MSSAATTECNKCQGRGVIRAFMHIDSGRCFQCAGVGRVELEPAPARAARPAPIFPNAIRVRQWYRNALSGYVTDLEELQEITGWTRNALVSEINAIPLARDAFAKLGWPV